MSGKLYRPQPAPTPLEHGTTGDSELPWHELDHVPRDIPFSAVIVGRAGTADGWAGTWAMSAQVGFPFRRRQVG